MGRSVLWSSVASLPPSPPLQYKTMIARSKAHRLAGALVAPLLLLGLHQHQAVGTVLGQQGADSQPAISHPADGMRKVTVHGYVR